jgi:hypothetical protein
MSKYTVESCYKELEPTLREIARLVKSAPISEKERSGLAMLILADVAGTTLAVMGLEGTAENMSKLGEFMASAFTPKGIN